MKNYYLKNKIAIVLSLLLLLLISGCANSNAYITQDGAGFFAGLWDGFTCWIAFIMNIFGSNVNIYEVKNNGNWYNLGFLVGSSTPFLGGILSSRSSSSCSKEDKALVFQDDFRMREKFMNKDK